MSSHGRSQAAALGLLVLGPILLLPGCTAILDFSDPVEPEVVTVDAGPPDAMSVPDATPAICSSSEPNEDIATAITLGETAIVSAICGASDKDFFKFEHPADTDLTVSLDFTGANLDLRLLNDRAETIGIANGTDDGEELVHTLAIGNNLQAGSYWLEVIPVNVVSVVEYTLTLAQVSNL